MGHRRAALLRFREPGARALAQPLNTSPYPPGPSHTHTGPVPLQPPRLLYVSAVATARIRSRRG
jgi:hypothetical protein